MSISRREFFKRGLALTGGALLPRWSWAESGADAGPAPDVVHVTGGGPENAVRAAVERLGGIGRFVRPGQKVVINPNVGFPNPPEMATTTDPRVIRTIAELCREAGASRIVIADYPVRDPQMCFDGSGIGDLGRLNGMEVMVLSRGSAYTDTDIPDAREVRKVRIATIVKESDVLIAAPIAKCHSSSGVSFAMKGMMGLIQVRGDFHMRYDLHQAVADLSRVLVADLVITDAQRALVTNGPGGPGEIATPGSIIAGTNQTSVDAYTVGIAQWYGRTVRPDQVRHIRYAHEQGLGEISTEAMNVLHVQL